MAIEYVILDGAVNGEILAGCLHTLQTTGKRFVTAEILLSYCGLSGVLIALDTATGKVVGVILADTVAESDIEQFKPYFDIPQDTLLLVQLAVLPKYRHKGIGTKLIRKTIQYSQDAEGKPFRNTFAVSRVPVVGEGSTSYTLLKRLGFKEVLAVPEFYADSEGFNCPACKSTCRCVGKLMLLHFV